MDRLRGSPPNGHYPSCTVDGDLEPRVHTEISLIQTVWILSEVTLHTGGVISSSSAPGREPSIAMECQQ